MIDLQIEELEPFDELAGLKPRFLIRPLIWVADKMSAPLFIIQFILFLIVWMVWNSYLIHLQFDPSPFMRLNLVMSAIAGIQCAVIGVKQTVTEYRRSYSDRKHQIQIDKVLLHLENMEEKRSDDAKRREDLQNQILSNLLK